MAACFLTSIPEDILLYIVDFLPPEDLLHLIQTCKSLYALTTIKTFWISCANTLGRRRRVHHLPLEELDTPELRQAIYHTLKLDLKWSGCEGMDPSPVRCIQIDPASHTSGFPIGGQAVTWVWFLEDGIHLTCIVGDAVVQLWNLPSNKPILSFSIGGTLVRASQYSDKDYFVMVGSVDVTEQEDYDREQNMPVRFKVWRNRWGENDAMNQLLPLAVLPLLTHPSAIFVTGSIAGVVYAADKTNEQSLGVEKDNLGYLTFHVVEWKGPCRTLRRFTPLSFFGDTRAEHVRSNLAHCDRTSSHFLISFEAMPYVDIYLYDMHHFNTFSVSQNFTVEQTHPDVVYPRLKATYVLNLEDAMPWLSGDMRQSWSQSCLLWDNYRMGILGFNVAHESGSRKAVLSLSVLDLSPLLAHDEDVPAYNLQGEYRRHILDRECNNLFYTTQNHRLLGNLPQYGTNNIWALRQSEAPTALAGLALGRFLPEDSFQTAKRIKIPEEMSIDSYGASTVSEEHEEAKTKRKDLLSMSLESWIPDSEQAEDLDLDDRLGRVAFGMISGKAYILEFI